MTKTTKTRPYRAKAAVYTKPYTFNMMRLRPHNPGDTVTVEISRDSVTVRPSGASKTVSADSVVGHFKDIQDRVAVQGPVSQVKHVLNVASRLLQTQGVTPLLRDGVDALRSENAAPDNNQ